jgi:nicotinamidase/pyrazinamidase
MRALLVVDIQNDFVPGGALEAPGGDQVIPVANRLIPRYERLITCPSPASTRATRWAT